MSKKRLFLTACPLYLAFYMGDAFLCSYYALYFLERGIPSDQQAILLALIPFSMFLGCLLFSAIAKNSDRALWVFRFCALAEIGLILGYAFASSFTALIILTPLIGLVNGAPFGLIEGYLVPHIEHKGGNYAFVRIFGSIGYAISLLVGAVLLRFIAIHDCFYFASGFIAIALGLSFLLREKPLTTEVVVEEEKQPKPKTKGLSYGAVIFCLSYALIYGSFLGSLYLIPIRLNNLGFQDADYSLMRGVGVVIEIVFFLLIPLFAKHFKNTKVPMVLAAGFYVVSTACCVWIAEPWSLATTFFLFNSIAKAFMFSFQARLLGKIVPEEDLSRVLTIAVGGTNFVSALFNLFSSSIFNAWGHEGFFGLISVMEIVGLGLLFALPKKGSVPAGKAE